MIVLIFDLQIIKADIDRTIESNTQHRCRVAFQWRGQGPPNSIDYRVNINGIRDLTNIELFVPLENTGNILNY